MKERLLNIKFQYLFVFLFASVLFGTGFSVSKYLSRSDARSVYIEKAFSSSGKLALLIQQQYKENKKDLIGWKIPDIFQRDADADYSISIESEKSIILLTKPKQTLNQNWEIITTIHPNGINTTFKD